MPLNADLNLDDQGPAVRALHEALIALAAQGFVPGVDENAARRALVEDLRAQRFGDATAELIARFQRAQDLAVTQAADAETRARMRALLGLDADEDGSAERRTPAEVSGVVREAHGPAAGAAVVLEVVALAGAGPIAEAVAGSDGGFVLRYDPAAAEAAAGFKPYALRVAATAADGRRGAAPALANGPLRVRGVEVSLPPLAPEAAPAAFTAMRERLAAAAEAAGRALADLGETDDDPASSLLAAETGVPPAAAALVAMGERIARETEGAVPAELVYALGAEGIGFDVVTLATTPPRVAEQAVRRAIRRGVVSERTATALAPARSRARTVLRARGAARLAASPLGTVLETAAGEEASARFFEAAVDTDREPEAVWDELREALGEETVARLDFALEATIATGARADAAAALVALAERGEVASFAEIAEWSVEDWAARFAEADVRPPPGSGPADGDEPEALSRYARSVARTVEAMHPARALAGRLTASQLPGRSAARAFLVRADERGFDPAHHDAAAWLDADDEAGEGVDEAARATVQGLGRVMRLGAAAAPAVALAGAALTSGRAIAAMGPHAFAQRFADAFDDPAEAMKIHATARAVSDGALELALAARSATLDESLAPISAIPISATWSGGTQSASPDLATWSRLFGTDDGCGCRHCASLVSPSAYLVEALRFLDDRPARDGGSALDVLLAPGRRADLAEVELTCANTDTVLPLIDLAIETLEDAVAPPFAFAPATVAGAVATREESDLIAEGFRQALNAALGQAAPGADFAVSPQARVRPAMEGADPTAWRIEDRLADYGVRLEQGGVLRVVSRGRATRGPSADRLAAPQYRNDAAYRRLSTAFFPWSLPFDRPRTAARAALDGVGWSLAAALDAAAPPPASLYPPRIANAADAVPDAALEALRRPALRERLGVAPGDIPLVEWRSAPEAPDFDPGRPWEVYGFAAETASPSAPVRDPESGDPIEAGRWIDLLAGRVDLVLERSGLDIMALLDVLDTRYVNPPAANGARSIGMAAAAGAAPDTCRLPELTLQGFDEPAAQRLARLVRLALRADLSVIDVDTAMTALGAAEPDVVLLDALGTLKGLHARLGGDWAQLCASFADADDAAALLAVWAPPAALRPQERSSTETRPAPSLYERVVRPHARDDGLPADPRVAPADPLSNVAPALAGALGVSPDALAGLAASSDVLPGGLTQPFALPAIARLHRHAMLSARLRLAPDTYVRALATWDRDPFASPARLARFVELVDTARDGPLALDDHARLTLGPSEAEDAAWAAEDDATLAGLAEALRAAAEATTPFLDAAADVEGAAQALRSLLTLAALPARLTDAVMVALSDAEPWSEAPVAPPVFTAPLANPPSGVNLTTLAEGAVSHAAGVLTVNGPLGPAARGALVAASTEAAWRDALSAIFDAMDAFDGLARFVPATDAAVFEGVIDAQRAAALDALDLGPDWLAATAAVAARQREELARLLRAARFDPVATPFAGPPDTPIPSTLAPALWWEQGSDGGRLVQRGPLARSEGTALRAAATGPSAQAFRDALDALESAVDAQPTPPTAALLGPGEVATILDGAPDATARLRLLVTALVPRVRSIAVDRTLTGAVAARFALGGPITERLVALTAAPGLADVRSVLTAPAFVAAPGAASTGREAAPGQHAAWRRLRQAAALVRALTLSPDDLDAAAAFVPPPDLQAAPIAPDQPSAAAPHAVAFFTAFATARRRVPGRADTLARIANAATAQGATADAVANAIAAESGLALESSTAVAAMVGAEAPASVASGFGLFRVLATASALTRRRLPAVPLRRLSEGAPAPGDDEALRLALVRGAGAARAREATRAASDAMRTASRDALLAHLIAKGRPAEGGLPARPFRSADEVYGHFLIDPQMGPCMETSRLRQAMSSVQLFAQRCLLGLEPAVAADVSADDGWLRWEWMRRYRVWQANREILFFPENLLRAEFIDEKSPLLRNCETALMRGDASPTATTRAVAEYVDGLRGIARLEPVATTVQATAAGDVLHVIGADGSDPRTLYHRRRHASGLWSPWEPMPLEVQSDHLLLHPWDGRLFFFWITVQAVEEDAELIGNSKVKSVTLQECRLHWSELAIDGWTEASSSRHPLRLHAEPDGFVFGVVASEGDELRIQARPSASGGGGYYVVGQGLPGETPPAPQWKTLKDGAFRIIAPGAEPIVGHGPAFWLDPELPNAVYRDSRQVLPAPGLGELGALALPFENDGTTDEALRRVRGPVSVVTSRDTSRLGVEDGPFFVDLRERSFLVTPRVRPLSALLGPLGRGPLLSDMEVWFTQPSRQLSSSPTTGAEDGLGDAATRAPFSPLKAFAASIGAVARGPLSTLNARPIAAALGEVGEANGQEATAEARRQVERRKAFFAASLVSRPDLLAAPEEQDLALGDISTRALKAGGDPSASALSADATWAGWSNAVAAPATEFASSLRVRYEFTAFHIPHIDTVLRTLDTRGLEAMLSRDVQLRPHALAARPTNEPATYRAIYGSDALRVTHLGPLEELDFDALSPAAPYLWELFHDIPALLARKHAETGDFEGALRWARTIFDPFDQSEWVTLADGTTRTASVARHWRTKPLFLHALDEADAPGAGRIGRLVRLLAQAAGLGGEASITDPADRRALDSFRAQIKASAERFGRPYPIARLRVTPFQQAAVMRFVEICLMAGDALNRRGTMESLNEALQYYTMAMALRGRPPQRMPPRALALPQTYRSLEPRLDALGNALVEIERFVPPSVPAVPNGPGGGPPPMTLAFCMPANEKLERLWARLAERLYNLRNCRDIDGVERRIPLFEPPIDPELLARAVASGIDIGAALADLDAPAPRRRFRALLQQAIGLTQEARALGQGLLSAIEKRDGETLAQLRARHEAAALDRAEAVRVQQEAEAEEALEGLRASRLAALERYNHYASKLGRDAAQPPDEDGAETAVAFVEARGDVAMRPAALFDMAADIVAGATGGALSAAYDAEGGLPVTVYEDVELALLGAAGAAGLVAQGLDTAAGVAAAFPDVLSAPVGVGTKQGGTNVAAALGAAATAARMLASLGEQGASLSAKAGILAMRDDDWRHQSNLAARDIRVLDRQIAAAALRRAAATIERENLIAQRDEAEAYEAALQDKFSNTAFYEWMVARLEELHREMLQLAHEAARRAERAARRELHMPGLSMIGHTQGDPARKRLLAADALLLDVRRLEAAYAEHDRREEEMIAHVSLARLDPAAFVRLRETGRAEFDIPEWVFDLAAPGQFLRRLRSVSISLPCVAGPYTGLHLRATLLSSRIRVSADLRDGDTYARRTDGDDTRFEDRFGPIDSIVTSDGREDDGLHGLDPQDDRLLPFEGAGAMGTWRVELPRARPTFDYGTISDVVLHLRYTARYGGDRFRDTAEDELVGALNAVRERTATHGLARHLDLRRDLPEAWQRFRDVVSTGGEAELPLSIGEHLFPFFVGRQFALFEIVVVVHTTDLDAMNQRFDFGFGPMDPSDRVAFLRTGDSMVSAVWDGVADVDRAAYSALSLRVRDNDHANQPAPTDLAATAFPSNAEIILKYRID